MSRSVKKSAKVAPGISGKTLTVLLIGYGLSFVGGLLIFRIPLAISSIMILLGGLISTMAEPRVKPAKWLLKDVLIYIGGGVAALGILVAMVYIWKTKTSWLIHPAAFLIIWGVGFQAFRDFKNRKTALPL